MNPSSVRADTSPSESLGALLEDLHHQGPDSQQKLEALGLYKEMFPEHFGRVEEQVLASMGLFYKLQEPTSLYSFLMGRLGQANKTADGAVLTPVQASVRRAIDDNQFVSISAPTSAGKSYSIRDFIATDAGDAVIVVPSRALIAEFIASLRSHFAGDKGVMVMPFVDKIFKQRELRRIFVLTPERAREIFDKSAELDVRVFFFDEAQVSEDAGRGVVFDVLVRRVKNHFPDAKLIFAHPFVENPEAQFAKHGLYGEGSFSKSYSQGAVGKVFVFRHSNENDYYFSPFEEGGSRLTNCAEFSGGFAKFALDGKKSILSYVSKASIYSGKFTEELDGYIRELPPVEAPEALEIIGYIKEMLGADDAGHRSRLISLMQQGVVIHHGSVPLEVRFLIEDFIRGGYARLCFATSTLAQGVNMPFDIVWLSNMRMQGGDEGKRSLSLKNLIGRAGRLSAEEKFDYGYVYTKNPKLLIERIGQEFHLSEESILNSSSDEVSDDVFEVINAIREGTFDDELHMPITRLDRLRSPETMGAMRDVLGLLYPPELSVADALRGRENKASRDDVRDRLHSIYESYLGRSLFDGEASVFKEAVSIMLSTFAGRSFREIAGLRFSRISRRDEKQVDSVAFSQQAAELPDSSLTKSYPLFPHGTKKRDVSYDVVVFDTYDYLDKVISFCLSDVFAASAKVFYDQEKDGRALKFIELLRFGTNDAMHVLMMRYGFLPDQIEDVLPYVLRISEDEIVFRRNVDRAGARLKGLVDWYR